MRILLRWWALGVVSNQGCNRLNNLSSYSFGNDACMYCINASFGKGTQWKSPKGHVPLVISSYGRHRIRSIGSTNLWLWSLHRKGNAAYGHGIQFGWFSMWCLWYALFYWTRDCLNTLPIIQVCKYFLHSCDWSKTNVHLHLLHSLHMLCVVTE